MERCVIFEHGFYIEVMNRHSHIYERKTASEYLFNIIMYKTIFVINIILHMCLQHSNTL